MSEWKWVHMSKAQTYIRARNGDEDQEPPARVCDLQGRRHQIWIAPAPAMKTNKLLIKQNRRVLDFTTCNFAMYRRIICSRNEAYREQINLCVPEYSNMSPPMCSYSCGKFPLERCFCQSSLTSASWQWPLTRASTSCSVEEVMGISFRCPSVTR